MYYLSILSSFRPCDDPEAYKDALPVALKRCRPPKAYSDLGPAAQRQRNSDAAEKIAEKIRKLQAEGIAITKAVIDFAPDDYLGAQITIPTAVTEPQVKHLYETALVACSINPVDSSFHYPKHKSSSTSRTTS